MERHVTPAVAGRLSSTLGATASLAWDPVSRPLSLLAISSITAGNHLVNRVAAHTKVPCTLPPRQPRSQTLILIPATTLRSVPITV